MCNNCLGYSSLAVCAHVVAACMKMDRTKNFLHWLVHSKCAKGCTSINLSKAVTFGMPKEKPPRKKGKDKKQTPLTIVPRIISSQNSPRMDVEGLLPSSHHDQQSSFQRQIVSTTSRSVNPF